MSGQKNLKTILVVKNRALGDAVIGLSTISYIKSLYPDAAIHYSLPAWITPLFDNVETDVDSFIPFKLDKLGGFFSLWKAISKLKPDAIFELHQAGRTKKFFSLYSFLKRVPYYFHNHHLKRGTKVHDQGVIKANIQRDLDGAWSLLSSSEKPIPQFLDWSPKMKAKEGEKKNRILLGVVATRKTKMWPIQNYVALAKMLSEKLPDYEIAIPLSNSAQDLEIKSELEALALPENAKIVQQPLSDLAIYISQAKLYVGNDTGLKHIAAASGVKTYTFFGPESPMEWHPYDQKLHPIFFRDNLSCRTQNAHYCGLSECADMSCLNSFSPDYVFEKVSSEFS